MYVCVSLCMYALDVKKNFHKTKIISIMKTALKFIRKKFTQTETIIIFFLNAYFLDLVVKLRRKY